MTRIVTLFTALALTATAAGSAPPAPTLWQPTSGERGLVLKSTEGRAWLERSNGRRVRLPLRRGERLLELTELEAGWAAAGVRETGIGRDLVVIVDGAAGVERLPKIPQRAGALRVRPVPLSSRSHFEGLAWLEGDSPTAYDVRAADWTGAEWTPPLVVSEARHGGQAGLAGEAMEDGSWLLVWSGSDGNDSELYWSWRRASRWSEPQRVAAANLTPDIMPTLLAVPGGALVVWARLDRGHYRLRSARFRDGHWSVSRPLDATDAAAPRFASLAEGIFLLYRSAAGWATLELDDDGRVVRRAETLSLRRDRPVLESVSGGIALRWGGGRQPVALDWTRLR